ncbi:hypothetical protein [Motilimonas eburnea]|uniref:hypothetical protein n=1 Tax=Motilimonas eburnea TaxID=1737488 RepID=UPI001E53F6DC|nr:hypothetical protein [Motilimonas eburnea]MCE2573742.1 hypothetical protein [Motilimonas eburnea]
MKKLLTLLKLTSMRLNRKRASSDLVNTEESKGSSWIEVWALYMSTQSVEQTKKTAAQLFDDVPGEVVANYHTFEYELCGRKYKAVLVEDLSKTSEPVKAMDKGDAKYAKVKVNPNQPSEYEFQYCDCGQPH